MQFGSKTFLYLTIFGSTLFTACDDDDDNVDNPGDNLEVPDNYEFTRNNASTVSFSGQTIRIGMANELAAELGNTQTTVQQLQEMYANQAAGGGDVNPFNSAELNNSDKSLRSKTAASFDYFNSNASESAQIRSEFETYLQEQVNTVYVNKDSAAAPGKAGQIADGSSVRYVNGLGLEPNQQWSKGLIGALMTDQMLNNYLGTAVLDEGQNRSNNDNGVTEEGVNYTTMEHKWDEAYGYLFGNAPDPADPLATLGEDDDYLNKYLGRVEGDDDFAGIANTIFTAFKRGRAAIVAGDYEERDRQANVLRREVSRIIAIRAVYYLQNGKEQIAQGKFGSAFHDLSEGYGFITSLRYTRNPQTDAPYFSATEVDDMVDQLLGDGPNGLWNVTTANLDALSAQIAARFDFTVEEAQ